MGKSLSVDLHGMARRKLRVGACLQVEQTCARLFYALTRTGGTWRCAARCSTHTCTQPSCKGHPGRVVLCRWLHVAKDYELAIARKQKENADVLDALNMRKEQNCMQLGGVVRNAQSVCVMLLLHLPHVLPIHQGVAYCGACAHKRQEEETARATARELHALGADEVAKGGKQLKPSMKVLAAVCKLFYGNSNPGKSKKEVAKALAKHMHKDLDALLASGAEPSSSTGDAGTASRGDGARTARGPSRAHGPIQPEGCSGESSDYVESERVL